MGRTGTLFACDADGVRPGVVTIAKGLGAGYPPICAMLCSGGICAAVEHGTGSFQHGHTYIGHRVVCATADVVVTKLTEGGLTTRAARRSAAAVFYAACAERDIAVQHSLYDAADFDLLGRFVPPDLRASTGLQLIFVPGRYSLGQQSAPRDLDPVLDRLNKRQTGGLGRLCLRPGRDRLPSHRARGGRQAPRRVREQPHERRRQPRPRHRRPRRGDPRDHGGTATRHLTRVSGRVGYGRIGRRLRTGARRN